MNQPNLTPDRLDTILIGRPERLWGAPAIAQALGVSVDTVYRWAKRGDVPIRRKAGRYYAQRREIERYLATS